MACADSFTRVRSLGKIFLYLLLVLIVGSLAAPIAWHLIQMLPPDLLRGLIGTLQGMPFHRYLSRSLQVAAIMLLWPLLRSLRVRSLGELGLFGNTRPIRDLGIGIFAGLFCIILLDTASLYSGAFTPFPWWRLALFGSFFRLLLTAVMVAILEEFLFRGILLGFLRQVTTPTLAIIFSAIFFSGVHFLNLPAVAAGDTSPLWYSGISLLGSVGSSFPPWPVFAWAFATLLAAGIILGWMTVRTGSLVAAIGLHGSWILGQQAFNLSAYFQVKPPETLLPFFGPPQCHGMVPVGLIPMGALILAGILAGILLRERPRPVLYPQRRD